MRTVTIPDPVEVQALLLREFPNTFCASASYDRKGWTMFVMLLGEGKDPTGYGATVEEALADLKQKMAVNSPESRLREKAAALGYDIVKREA